MKKGKPRISAARLSVIISSVLILIFNGFMVTQLDFALGNLSGDMLMQEAGYWLIIISSLIVGILGIIWNNKPSKAKFLITFSSFCLGLFVSLAWDALSGIRLAEILMIFGIIAAWLVYIIGAAKI